MGLTVSVYRDAGSDYDCTMNGVTKRFTRLCVINADGPFEPSEDCPAVKLEVGPFNSIRLVPVEVEDEWTMFGGNYAATSDSRLGYAIKAMTGYDFYGAIPVHDRVES